MEERVAPFAGAWIEISTVDDKEDAKDQSLPSRERGLKFSRIWFFVRENKSLPSRERGLKYCKEEKPDDKKDVAPFAGAWIEI